MSSALPAFTTAEQARCHRLLAAQVARMMGAKLEEDHWSAAYCAAKTMPRQGWSNLSIDVMHGNLGVEHKMLCYRSRPSLLEACGTTLMHPAGTRSIRVPNEADPTKAAREVLRQYGELIHQRTHIVQTLDAFHGGRTSRDEAIAGLMENISGLSRASASSMVPQTRSPTSGSDGRRPPDMRTGWLLWQESLREFLYFEEAMVAPNPAEYVAQWQASGGGRRKPSKNLWVTHRATGQKRFSITTEAGPKIQPYFSVPPPDDPALYHFVVQGEPYDEGIVRMWVAAATAERLRVILGSLDHDTVSGAVQERKWTSFDAVAALSEPEIEEIHITAAAYAKLRDETNGVSDEHCVQLLITQILKRRRD